MTSYLCAGRPNPSYELRVFRPSHYANCRHRNLRESEDGMMYDVYICIHTYSTTYIQAQVQYEYIFSYAGSVQAERASMCIEVHEQD